MLRYVIVGVLLLASGWLRAASARAQEAPTPKFAP